MKKHILLFAACLTGLFFNSCKKQDAFLDTKPNQALEIPTSLSDIESLLQNNDVFNRAVDPELGEIASDDFDVQDGVFANLDYPLLKNSYTWSKTLYDPINYIYVHDWSDPYQMVYYANTVLDDLPAIKIIAGQQSQYNQIKGAALFYRSFAFYNLVQTFALPYNSATAGSTLGIPLRLTSDINARPPRSNEADCYNQILTDLKNALPLLPVTPAYKTAPSQPAVNALLARIYLAMADYPSALQYANACLAQFNSLEDYNTLNSPTTSAISNTYLTEDIYHTGLVSYTLLATRRNSYIDSALYLTYSNNDLRKTKFFTILDGLPQYPRFVGSYDPKNSRYDGLATDEIYLIKAECLARAGDMQNAMGTLNALLVNRWKTGTFIPYTATSADDALTQILLERRKELLERGLRWTDLRRLNQESRFAITLTKKVDGVTYTLPPNDPRYAFPIPYDEITLDNLIQNAR